MLFKNIIHAYYFKNLDISQTLAHVDQLPISDNNLNTVLNY